ncbi:MAG: ABC transporter permease, partial [Myxococcota bacterium]|nr:ABC transporter permease [Myxococcota bacterium]
MAQPIPIAGLAAGYMLLSLFAIWALYLSLPLQVRLIRSLFNILGRRNDLRTMLFGVFVLISTPLVIGSALTVLQKAPPAVQYYLLTGAQLLAVVQSVLLIVAFITWLVMFGVRFLGQPVFARRYELFVGWNLLRSHSTKQHQPRPFEGATPPAQWTTQLLGILFLLVLATSFTVQWPVLLDTYADIVPWLRWGIGSSAVLLLTWPLRRTPAPGSVDQLDRLEARAKNLPDVLTVTANTFISIVGVGVGVWAVIVVLSVMSGFENDLRDKILKTNPHVVIQDDEPMEGIPNYRNTLQSIRELDGVIAAIPYVQGDVIVTSRENRNISLSLRGITP